MTPDDSELLGLLAVRTGLISEERLSTAKQHCKTAAGSDLGAVLQNQGDLSEASRKHLESLVAQHKRMRRDEFEKSLATINPSDFEQNVSDIAGNSTQPIASVAEHETADFDPEVLPSASEEKLDAPPPDPNQTKWTPTKEASADGNRYVVLRNHAKGGMGLISLAIDTELDREVAFKELQDYCADDRNSRARFVREAEITGKLEHPGVVPVYGLGSHADGRPYYAMRFVQGDSLGEQISRFHKNQSSTEEVSRNSMELRALLGRFVDICNAIAYAHSRGVLHRDIKPDNVMLGRFGETLVVDWGLAKLAGAEEGTATEELPIKSVSGEGSTATRMGSATGTPAYMSPEQAAGQLDRLKATSDVYSLGATLYCLLTGQAPISGDSITEVLRKARQGEFTPPKVHNPNLPAALSSICCRAMELQPDRRYPTPLALAADVERWLSDETVDAHPENFAEKTARWFRRHRTLALVSASALALIAVVSVVSAIEINRQRTKAVKLSDENVQLAEQEREAKLLATERFKESRETVDTWLTGFSEALAYYPGVQAFRERMLLKAAEDYEGFVATKEADPEMELERGRTLLRLGDLRRVLLQMDEAKQAYQQSLVIFQALSDASANQMPSLELAQATLRTAILADEVGDTDAARQDYDRTIEIGKQLLEQKSPELAAHLVVAEARSRQGILSARLGNVEHAIQTLTESVTLLEQQKQFFEQETEWVKTLADAHVTLGQLLISTSKRVAAEESFETAISSYDSLTKLEEDNPRFLESKAAALIHLATAHRVGGHWDEEAGAYEQAIEAYQRLITAMPDVPSHRENLSLTQNDLGQLLRESYRPSEAVEQLQQALQVAEQLAAEYPSMVRFHEEHATCLSNLGQALQDLGKYTESLAVHKKSAEIFGQLVENVPNLLQYRERHAISKCQLATVLHALMQIDSAIPEFLSAIDILERYLETTPDADSALKALAVASERYGDLLVAAKKHDQAEPVYRDARESWQKLVGRSPHAEYLHRAALFHVLCPSDAVRDAKQAVTYASRAIELAPTNPLFRSTLAAAHLRSGRFSLSASLASESLSDSDGNRGLAYFILAMSQYHLGQTDQANKSLQAGITWQAKHAAGRLTLNRLADEVRTLLNRDAEPAE